MSKSRSSQTAEQPASAWSRLELLVGRKRRTVLALVVTSITSGFAEAAILASVAQVAAILVSKAARVYVHAGPIHLHATPWDLLAIAGALAVFRLLLQAPISMLPARIAADVQAGQRRRLFEAFTRASWAAQSQDREGHLQEMMTNQVVQATQGALQASTLITALVTFLTLVISALALNLIAAAVVLGAAGLLFGALRPLNAIGARRARALSAAQLEYAGGVGEATRLAEETQVFGVAAAQRERVGDLIEASRDLFYRTQMLGRAVPSIYQSIIFLIIVAGLAILYGAGAGHVASLGAVVLLLVRAGTYGQQIQGSYQFLRQALPYVERLQQAEQHYRDSTPSSGTLALDSVNTIAFEDVSYAYRPDRPVLREVSFEVERGETIGIVGPSGAGKSTLVQILLQLRRPDAGRYLINGVAAEQFASHDWHARNAYVPQDPRLVHASVAENIRYFRDIDDTAIERAARLARIHDDIVAWAEGYDTIIGPRADAVSGGQQQRICLARALAAEPEVIVLDEPTSALDPRSEALIQESLLALEGSVTLFIVAHRMSTLDICNRVMVVLDGRLDGFGTVSLLQGSNSYYRSALALAGTAIDAAL